MDFQNLMLCFRETLSLVSAAGRPLLEVPPPNSDFDRTQHISISQHFSTRRHLDDMEVTTWNPISEFLLGKDSVPRKALTLTIIWLCNSCSYHISDRISSLRKHSFIPLWVQEVECGIFIRPTGRVIWPILDSGKGKHSQLDCCFWSPWVFWLAPDVLLIKLNYDHEILFDENVFDFFGTRNRIGPMVFPFSYSWGTATIQLGKSKLYL